MPELQLQNTVTIAGITVSLQQLLQEFSGSSAGRAWLSVPHPVAVVVADAFQAFSALTAMASRELDALLLSEERLSPAVRALLETNGFVAIDYGTGQINAGAVKAPAVGGRVSLLTSGSTGTPKLVHHSWHTLFTAKGLKNVQPRRWLLPYQTGTYAWYQLATLALFQAHQSLVVSSSDDLETTFRQAVKHGVDSISATPTFWRLATFRVPDDLLRSLRLTTITLGGEQVDQAILDRLAHLFPDAQITHIYASTEAGTCIVVKDGQTGFPRKLLERNDPGLPSLKISEGRLWIRSPYSTNAACGAGERWVDSGDLVEVRGGRVYFVGRSNCALINVGGNKAYPADIEAVLLKHPQIRWCRVRAVRSPLVGFLPEADVVFSSQQDIPDEAALTRYCAEHLAEYAIPRFWNRLNEIPVQASLKSAL